MTVGVTSERIMKLLRAANIPRAPIISRNTMSVLNLVPVSMLVRISNSQSHHHRPRNGSKRRFDGCGEGSAHSPIGVV